MKNGDYDTQYISIIDEILKNLCENKKQDAKNEGGC